VGHALEAVTRYKAMLHGEAVAWGMVAALALGWQRGTLAAGQMDRLESLIYRYGPLPALTRLNARKIVAATSGDKKNVGGVRRFVLPQGIGDAGVVEDVTPAELETAVKYMLEKATSGRSIS
jgi:3-dehydroquinate synthase